MILINLLPPELRKSRSGINPMFLSAGLGAVLSLLMVAFFCWIHFGKIPAARRLQDDKELELQTKTEQAQKVLDLEGQIQESEDRRAKLLELLGKKVYWAHTLDDLSNMLSGGWPGNFNVRCLDLGVTPLGGDRHGESIAYSVRVRLQLVGDERSKAGDYVKSFFRTTQASTFWKQDGFIGKPEDTYFGDTPAWNQALSKVVIPFNLEFQRVKVLSKQKAGG